jgi:hypothetical protein
MDPGTNAALSASRCSGAGKRSGGEGGIRTHGEVSPTHAFQACSFSHSDTSPREARAGLSESADDSPPPGSSQRRPYERPSGNLHPPQSGPHHGLRTGRGATLQGRREVSREAQHFHSFVHSVNRSGCSILWKRSRRPQQIVFEALTRLRHTALIPAPSRRGRRRRDRRWSATLTPRGALVSGDPIHEREAVPTPARGTWAARGGRSRPGGQALRVVLHGVVLRRERAGPSVRRPSVHVGAVYGPIL